jgi:hypothetical protein
MSLLKKQGQGQDVNKIDNILIASRPGSGKTSSLLQLPDSIYFDLESSSGYFYNEGDVADIKAIMKSGKVGMLTAITRVTEEVKASGKKYKFAIVDTLTKLDELADLVATAKYKLTPAGKAYTGSSVKELAYGAGYGLIRAEFANLTEMFDGIADTIIYACHVKDSSIAKDGDQYGVTDINLTGQLKEIFSAKQDTAALLEIDPSNPNQRILNFVKTDQNSFVKSRPAHLHNQKIVISEYDPATKTLKTHWDRIFLNLSK